MRTVQSTPAGIVRALLDAVENRDLESMGAFVADDLHFRFGNADPTDTKADFAATMDAFVSGIAGLRHEVIDMWQLQEGNTIALIVTMDVHYKRLDGHQLVLPCCDVFRVRDGLIYDYRIYMDVNPVITPEY
jgi:ketosteroid isomerase-like protein